MRVSIIATRSSRSSFFVFTLFCSLLLLVLGLLLPPLAAAARVDPQPLPIAHHDGRSSSVASRRVLAAADSSSSNNVSSCPLDFSILNKYTWMQQACGPGANMTNCCESALSGMGLATAMYLKETSDFELPDMATTLVCFDAYRDQLRHIGVQRDVVTECSDNYSDTFSATLFTRSPKLCRGIETLDDFRRITGGPTVTAPVDSNCKSLPNHGQCSVCMSDMSLLISQLSASGSTNDISQCTNFVILYAAGIVNEAGPWDPATATCILAVQYNPPESSHTGLFIGLGAAAAGLISVAAALTFLIARHRRKAAVHREFVARNNKMLKQNAAPLLWFDWMELKAATHGFSKKHLVGEGSFGSVYKGVLKDGRTIAIKRFRNCTPEGDADFLNEVDMISKVKHRNLVVLRGCCVGSNHAEGHQRMLVYDFMVKGSLADCLFDKSKPVLGWSDRRKIGIGMARGLAYLHAEVVPQIIHRDVKASNILLDEQFNARVADFGLAKLAPEGETHFTTHVAGTHGYVAPEYALYGQLTESSDVYSFGVCLLELISGRTALTATSDKQYVCLITDWAWLLLKEGKGIEVVDQAIRNMGSQEVMLRFVKVGILCAHLLVAFRPSMMDALKMLEGDCDIPEIPDRPLPLMMPDTLDLESFCLSSSSQLSSSAATGFDADVKQQ
ncbi:unnamed protein product [Sphagnum troendelagicum]